MKIITICGSLKFQKEMMEIAEKMSKQGNCVLTPVYPVSTDKSSYTEEEIKTVGQMHFERIKLSDAILVVNVDNYIGNSTKREIEFAESLGKEVIYYTDLKCIK